MEKKTPIKEEEEGEKEVMRDGKTNEYNERISVHQQQLRLLFTYSRDLITADRSPSVRSHDDIVH